MENPLTMKHVYIFLLYFIFCTILPQQVFAKFVYESVLTDASDNILNSQTLKIRFQIRSENVSPSDCLLYEEIHTITTDTQGYFSAVVGMGTRSDAANVSNSALAFDKVLQNAVAFSSAVPSGGDGTATGTCVYTPVAGAGRRLLISLTSDLTGAPPTGWDPLGYIMLYPPANAVSADSVGGLDSSKIMSVTTGTAPALTSAQATELVSLVNGASTKYAVSSANGNGTVGLPPFASAPATPVAGNIWYDTSSNEVKFYNGTATVPLGSGGGGHPAFSGDVTATANSGVLNLVSSGVTAGSYGSATMVPQITVDAKGRVTSASTVAVSAAPTGVASGDLSGSYPAPTVSKIQGRTVSAASPTVNQVLSWVSGQWEPQYLKYADLVNNTLSSPWPAPCVAGEALTYSTIGDSFVCTQIVGGISTGIANGGNTPAADVSIGTNNSHGLNFKTNGVNRMTVAVNGNVGLGVTTPAEKFVVYDSTATGSAITVSNPGTGATQQSMLNLETYNPSASAAYGVGGSKGWQLYANSENYSPGPGVFGITYWSGTTWVPALEINPQAGVKLNGVLLQKTIGPTSSIFDYALANTYFTLSSCGAFTLNNLKEGGSYTLLVKGASSGTCAFTAYSDVGTTALTVKYPSGHGAVAASTQTLYNFVVIDGVVFVKWNPGY